MNDIEIVKQRFVEPIVSNIVASTLGKPQNFVDRGIHETMA